MKPQRRPPEFEEDTLRPPFFVVSDTHWYHKNIVRYSGRPENHDRLMVDRWNSVVGDDVVLHLGDLFWPGRKNERYERFAEKIAPRLKGEKYLILGNHDDPKTDFKRLGFTPIKPFRIRWSRPKLHYPEGTAGTRVTTTESTWVEFAHYPSEGMIPGYLRVHGHIHTNGYGPKGGPFLAKRLRNVNVSVEAIDYTPQPIEKVLREVLS